jgi:hypothetical protein
MVRVFAPVDCAGERRRAGAGGPRATGRRIYQTDKHSESAKTSWHGGSIGRYEGDTLVVDTIGLDERTFLDGFNTPHTKEPHVAVGDRSRHLPTYSAG